MMTTQRMIQLEQSVINLSQNEEFQKQRETKYIYLHSNNYIHKHYKSVVLYFSKWSLPVRSHQKNEKERAKGTKS